MKRIPYAVIVTAIIMAGLAPVSCSLDMFGSGEPASLTLSEASLSYNLGSDSGTLTVIPTVRSKKGDTIATGISWEIGTDASAYTVVYQGNDKLTFTPTAAGQYYVKASCESNSSISATCIVNVRGTEPTALAAISLSSTSVTFDDLSKAEATTLSVTQKANDGSSFQGAIEWVISNGEENNEIVYKGDDKLTFVPLKAGNFYIQARSKATPSVYATCTVSVKTDGIDPSEPSSPASLSLSQETVTFDSIESITDTTLTVTVTANDGSPVTPDITWYFSNGENSSTVTRKGNDALTFRPNATGTYYIRASVTGSRSIYAICSVTVKSKTANSGDSESLASVRLSKNSITWASVAEAATATLSVTQTSNQGHSMSGGIDWHFSGGDGSVEILYRNDSAIAFTPKASGVSYVRASAKDNPSIYDICTLTVRTQSSHPEDPTYPASVTLSEHSLTFPSLESVSPVTLTAATTANSGEAMESDVSWSFSNGEEANDVTFRDGKSISFTPKATGTWYVQATCNADGAVYDTCIVTVKGQSSKPDNPAYPSSLTLSRNSVDFASLSETKPVTVTATTTSNAGTAMASDVTWSFSSGEDLYDISYRDGKQVTFTPKATGTSFLKATCNADGAVYAVCSVTVRSQSSDPDDPDHPAAVTLDRSSVTFPSVAETEEVTLIASMVSNSGATMTPDVSWTFSNGRENHDITYEDTRQISFTPKAAGTYYVQATCNTDSNVYAVCMITVRTQSTTPETPSAPAAIRLDTSSIGFSSISSVTPVTLNATTYANSGEEMESDVTWTFSNGRDKQEITFEDSKTIVFTPKATGTSYVQATSKTDPNVYAICTVNVRTQSSDPDEPDAPASVALDRSAITFASIADVESTTLTAEMRSNSGATMASDVEWTFSNGRENQEIAYESPSQIVFTPKRTGTSYVQATSNADAALHAVCTVTVRTQSSNPDEPESPALVRLDRTSVTFPSIGEATPVTLTATTISNEGKEIASDIIWSFPDGEENVEMTNNTKSQITFTPKTTGTFLVRATCNADDAVSTTCTITVRTQSSHPDDPTYPSSVTLDHTSFSYASLDDTSPATITATMTSNAGTAMTPDIIWSFSNGREKQAIHAESESQISFTPKATGTYYVKASSSKDPAVYAVCTVTVRTASSHPDEGTSAAIIHLDKKEVTFDSIDKVSPVTINATTVSNDGSEMASDVEWVFSDERSRYDITYEGPGQITFTPKATGTSHLMAIDTEDSAIYAVCTITVRTQSSHPDDPDYPAAVILSRDTLSFPSLAETEAVTLTATTITNAGKETPSDVSWTFSNGREKQDITFEDGGKIVFTPKATGTFYVRATSNADSAVYAICTISVKSQSTQPDNPSHPAGTVLDKHSVTFPSLSEVTPVTLKATMTSNAGESMTPDILWTFSNGRGNQDIAYEDGSTVTFSPKVPGTFIVRASSGTDTAVHDTCAVTVRSQSSYPDEPSYPASVTLDQDAVSFGSITEVSPVTLNATTISNEGKETASDVTWTFSNGRNKQEIHAETKSQISFTPKATGTWYVKATASSDSAVYDICTITVRTQSSHPDDPAYPSAVTLSRSDVSFPSIDSVTPVTLTASMTSNEGKQMASDVSWSFSNGKEQYDITQEDKTTITFTPKATGSYYVKATSNADSAIYATCTIYVKGSSSHPDNTSYPSSLRLSADNFTFSSLDSVTAKTLSVTVIDNEGKTSSDAIDWLFSNGKENYEITYQDDTKLVFEPLSSGTYYIKASCRSDSSVYAVCTITVKSQSSHPDDPDYPSSLKLSRTSVTFPSLAAVEPTTLEVSLTSNGGKAMTGDILWTFSGGESSSDITYKGNDSLTFTPKKTGVSYIQATSALDSGIYDVCTVNVKGTVSDNAPSSLTLSASSLNFDSYATAEAKTLSVTMLNGSGEKIDGDVTWYFSTDKSGYEVVYQGNDQITFKPTAEGTWYVKASATSDSMVYAVCTVTVGGALKGLIPSVTKLSIVAGHSGKVTIGTSPSGTETGGLLWSVDDPSVAYFESQSDTLAVIHGQSIGTATVTVRPQSAPTVSAKIAVSVTSESQSTSSIKLSASSVNISPTKTDPTIVTATLSTNDAELLDTSILFQITPSGIVEAMQTGNSLSLLPLATGQGSVTAYLAADTSVNASIPLYVGGKLTGISAKDNTSALSVDVGETATLNITYTPETATAKEVTWTSSNTAVATVWGSGSSAVVSGITSGNVTIRAQSATYPEIYCEFYVVIRSIINEISYTSEDGTQKGLTFTTPTDTGITLTASLSPAVERKLSYRNRTPNLGTILPVSGTINDITFSPSDPTVGGTAMIDVTYGNGFSRELDIDLIFDDLRINSTREILEKSGAYELSVTREDGSVPEGITWASSDANIASVNSSGTVSAKSPGTANITATVPSGSSSMSFSSSIFVNVPLPQSFKDALRLASYRIGANNGEVSQEYLDRITTLDLSTISYASEIDLSAIASLPNITILNLSNRVLKSSYLSLSGLTKLQTLTANNCQATGMKLPSSIKSVTADRNQISSLSPFASMPYLTYVSLRNNLVSSVSSAVLSNVTTLDLTNNQMSGTAKVTTANLPAIRKLVLTGNPATSLSVSSSTIEELRADDMKLSYNTQLIQATINAPNLRILDLSGNRLGVKSGQTAYAENGASVPFLSPNNEQNDAKVPARAIVIDFLPKLEEIDLSDNYLRTGMYYNGETGRTDTARHNYPFVISSPNLRNVDISRNHIGNNFTITNGSYAINALQKSSRTTNGSLIVTHNNMLYAWFSDTYSTQRWVQDDWFGWFGHWETDYHDAIYRRSPYIGETSEMLIGY